MNTRKEKDDDLSFFHRFVEENGLEYSQNRVSADALDAFAAAMDVTFGRQLRDYLVQYGYLAFLHWEMYGNNKYQGSFSDMVRQTCYLHAMFPETQGYTAIEHTGDGFYCFLDETDQVFEFDCKARTMEQLHTDLCGYVQKRFFETEDSICS